MISLKKNVLKIVLVMLVVLAVIAPISVYAASIITPGNATPSPAPVTTPTPTTTPSPKVTPTPTTQPNLPKTGIEDYTGLIVVTIVLGGSAIFAYKKIKEYKNI